MDDRKLKILAAVIDEYILTGEPVGSKTIASLPDIKVSAATVRNDMAVLEQMGYLEQPHTSAGRVPTFSGYRLYIDRIMTHDRLPDEEIKRLDSMLEEKGALTEELIIESATTALAELTKCAAVASNSSPEFSVISKVEVIPTGKRLYVILLITSNGSIKNKACRLEFDLTNEQLDFFTNYIQENLAGVSVSELSDEMLAKLVEALGTYMLTLSPLVQGVYELSQGLLKKELKVSGTNNLLSCGELDTMEIVKFMDHHDELEQLMNDSFSGIHVMFSGENDGFVIGNSSMIVSNYQRGSKKAGSLGVIGPMRLDYSKIIPYIEYFTQKITDLISEDTENDGKEDDNV
ncbi:MAG: heat-inducible transcriptional repressor HrcA [Clostridium sp.]|nr:heat-inducible transcriptional repressor HrcA [Clostridium sp.]MCM1547851.1 heat-inducible transcriptional repressor HrcA [Ruminococcus sp.]